MCSGPVTWIARSALHLIRRPFRTSVYVDGFTMYYGVPPQDSIPMGELLQSTKIVHEHLGKHVRIQNPHNNPS